MPHTTSAAKRLRQNVKRRLRNQVRVSRAKTAEKRFVQKLEGGSREEAAAALQSCFSMLDKAAKRHSISRNRASRKKSRLAKRLNALAKGPTPAAPATPSAV
ncbi:MAG: 30S ribosomal protein S20 [Lentisphaerae bacterium ADurb.BinA184]|nr:MAG: 30S ribosomal protein S20 [Lentisphaerae bacterium ADurb.BinA184]